MPRSEAQIRADKKHREKLKKWSADVYITEAESIDAVRKRHGLSCRELLYYAAEQLHHERDIIPHARKLYAKCETFKEVRKLSGLTQARFSEILRIPIGTVQAWDTEKREVSSYQLELIKYFLVHEGIINTKKTEED